MTFSIVHLYFSYWKNYPVKTLQFPSKHQAEGRPPPARTPLSTDAQPQLTQGCKSESEVNLKSAKMKGQGMLSEITKALQQFLPSILQNLCESQMLEFHPFILC